MRAELPTKLIRGRIIGDRSEHDGAFEVLGPAGLILRIIASSGGDTIEDGWEHVSVSTQHRVPTWYEMCFVKDLFWDENEVVVQYHPAKSEYVNYHPNCLHLWRHRSRAFPAPPALLVGGVKDVMNPTEDERAAIEYWRSVKRS